MQIKQAELVTEQQTGTDNDLISEKTCHTVLRHLCMQISGDVTSNT